MTDAPADDRGPHRRGRRRPAPPPKAGRDLRAAVGVGLLLAGLVDRHPDHRRPAAFLVVVVVAVSYGAWELRRAIATRGMVVPLVPLLLGAVGMLVSAYLRGAEALVVTFGLTIVGLLVWRVADGLAGAARDLSASALVAFYPIFLGGFASMMLAAPDDGAAADRRLHPRHRRSPTSAATPSASCSASTRWRPSLSPKKSWEGFAGLGRHVCRRRARSRCPLVLGGQWWQGALLGVAAAVRGDPGRPHRVAASSATSASRTWARCCPGTAA